MKKEYIIPIFVPHLGCPNACTFCNQRSISGETKMVTKEDVKEQIEYYLSNFKDENKYVEVAFFGGSFTGIDEEIQNELLEAANEFIKEKKVKSIRISTRPDYINKEILKRLKKYNVKTIELGVQSTNNYILEKCRRGHSFEDVKKASKLIRRYRFTLGHQMMLGLPDSTKLDEIKTAKDLIKLKPKMVRIYPVLVIKGTKLEEDVKLGKYTPLTVNQAVDRAKDIVRLFQKKHIEVIRIGLQNTNTITDPNKEESEVVCGPYHPAFRQLVESSMWYDAVVDKIKKINSKVKKVEIRANSININNIIGHKKENINKLKDVYDVLVKVVQDDTIKPGRLKLNVLKTFDEIINEERDVIKEEKVI